MLTTVEAVVEKDGRVRLLEEIKLTNSKRALVVIFDDDEQHDTALASEAALAEDWNRTEEDEAWQHLQQAQ